MLDPHTNPQQEHSFLFNSGPEKKREDNTTYDAWRPMNYSSRAQKTAQKYKTWKSMGALRNNDKEDDEESGVCSPPLWKSTTTSSGSPPPKSPNFRPNNYQSLSPASRTQAIARGQREMMDMVRNMPESCYELSLKDLVERRPTAMTEAVGRAQAEEEEEEDEILMKREYEDGILSKNKKKTKKPLVLRRSGSIDSGGFLLKMVFPISLGSKNKKMMSKKNKSDTVVVANSVSAKVSPKPPSAGVDKDWWKKRVSASRSESGRSESGVSSINSGSMKSSGSSSSSCCTSRSSSRHKTGGCLSFILLKKNKRQDDKNELSS